MHGLPSHRALYHCKHHVDKQTPKSVSLQTHLVCNTSNDDQLLLRISVTVIGLTLTLASLVQNAQARPTLAALVAYDHSTRYPTTVCPPVQCASAGRSGPRTAAARPARGVSPGPGRPGRKCPPTSPPADQGHSTRSDRSEILRDPNLRLLQLRSSPCRLQLQVGRHRTI